MKRLTFIAAAALCACPGPRVETLPDGGSLNGPVTFRLSYNSTLGHATGYLQTGREQEWLSVLSSTGTVFPIESACWCPCGQCSACLPCPERKPKVIQVPQFGSTSTVFSGFYFPNEGACGDSKCQNRKSLDPGVYIAKFCFATTFTDNGNGTATVGPTTCQEQSFQYPPDGGSVVALSACDGC